MMIGELSRLTGITSSAIRFYEQEGLLPRVRRLSGRRVFDDRSVAQLIVIQLAKSAGFTLAEVRQLVTEFGQSRWRRLAERKLIEVQAASERLRTITLLLDKLLKCKCPDIEFCGRTLQRHGLLRRTTRAKIPSRAANLKRQNGAPSESL